MWPIGIVISDCYFLILSSMLKYTIIKKGKEGVIIGQSQYIQSIHHFNRIKKKKPYEHFSKCRESFR